MKTVWEAAKTKVMKMKSNHVLVLPTSTQAIPGCGLQPNPVIHDVVTPLCESNTSERLRAYHSRVDLLHTILNPDQTDLDWQVCNIICHQLIGPEKTIMLKISWIGGDKQWISLVQAQLHDPFLVIRYALKNNLMTSAGWEWTKSYRVAH